MYLLINHPARCLTDEQVPKRWWSPNIQRRRKVKLQNPASGFCWLGMEGATAPRQPSVMSSVNGGSLHCFQRLHKEMPLSLEDLEDVFDTLDADGNGFLTPEEFTTGFSKF